MAELFKNSLEIIEKGFSSLKNMKKDKQEYKQTVKRIHALPPAYGYVYDKITKYLWSYYNGGDGYDMLAIQLDLLDLFETSAAEGKDVLDVTGEDVAAFSDELLRSANTYTEDRREKLNQDILKKINKQNQSK